MTAPSFTPEVGGKCIGQPGKAGTPAVYHFTEPNPPGQSTSPLVQNAANGSLFSNTAGGSGSTLFVKIAGTWTAIA